MPTTRIRDRFQVTIPAEIRRQIDCREGDLVEVTHENGRIILVPQKTVPRLPIPKLTKEEQNMVASVRQKILKLQIDPETAVGLKKIELALAVKAGLIEKEEAWWYGEEWQAGERTASREIREGEVSDKMTMDELDRKLGKL